MSTPPKLPDKQGLSTGAIIAIVVVAVLIIGAGVCIALVTGV